MDNYPYTNELGPFGSKDTATLAPRYYQNKSAIKKPCQKVTNYFIISIVFENLLKKAYFIELLVLIIIIVMFLSSVALVSR